MTKIVNSETIKQASEKIRGIISDTPLQFSKRLSREYGAKVYLKREDLQEVRSYKIRGAYYSISSLSEKQKSRGVVCASAGNHAQGVALSASLLKLKATIFMSVITPNQKINRVKYFGGEWVEVKLIGQNYDETCKIAQKYSQAKGAIFVHPFDDYVVISGQGTVGKEIHDELRGELDYLLCPIGGGGLISGVSTYIKSKSRSIQVIGVEPFGCASMHNSKQANKVITLDEMDPFVDGVAVKTVGKKALTFVQKNVDEIVIVPEGKVCTTMIELYQNEGIITEPAGALSVSGLDSIEDKLKGKTVVCIISGGNNDIMRYPEIMERSLVFRGLKHYFLIEFAQKPGQLRKFVDSVLGPTDDITRFEYINKTSKEMGPALIGIELAKKEDLNPLTKRMDKLGFNYRPIVSSDILYSYLV